MTESQRSGTRLSSNIQYLKAAKLETIRSISQCSRTSSPERSNTPVRQRPSSPLKLDVLPDDRSTRLLDIAKKERALSELKEKRRELEAQIRQQELDLDLAKRQLASETNPLTPMSTNTSRKALPKEKDMEALQNIAEGMSAIWNDIRQATIGDQSIS